MKNVFGGIMHVHFPVRVGEDCGENGKALRQCAVFIVGRGFYSEAFCCPAETEIGGGVHNCGDLWQFTKE